MIIRQSIRHASSGLVISLVISLGSAKAQTIQIEGLEAAQAFTPGISIDGALESNAWAGTTANRAGRLMSDIPTETDHPIVRDILRRVVLSGLVPPAGATDEFERTRIMRAQDLATADEYSRLAARNPMARDPGLRADAYIARGDLASACDISDAVQHDRGSSYWIRIRAACHDLREETASADLARDILRDRGDDTELFVPEPAQDFWADILPLSEAELSQRMTLLAGDPAPAGPPEATPTLPTDAEGISLAATPTLEDAPEDNIEDPVQDISSLQDTNRPQDGSAVTNNTALPTSDRTEPISLFASEPEASLSNLIPGSNVGPEPKPDPTFDLTDALDNQTDEGTARLFLLAKDGHVEAVDAFTRRAVEAGYDPSLVLSRIPAVLDPEEMARVNLPLFARHAVVTRDIDLIQALYRVTEDETVRERLALASDAMGGGFDQRALGESLETALQDGSSRAMTDVMMALALGSDLTESVEAILGDSVPDGTATADWLALDHAVDRRAKAESLLRVSSLLERRDIPTAWDLYRTIAALRQVGYPKVAGQIAAYEYLRGL